MAKLFTGTREISEVSPSYFIAEIGNNHQGEITKAMQLIKVAADCGADAVKFQKRNNKLLFTKAMFEKPYENENSYGTTYGEHREYLEFNRDQFIELKEYAEELGVDFMSTAFDFDSVDFLESIDVPLYKIASADLTNIPLITYIASLHKPMFISTGACTLDEVRLAYDAVKKYHNKFCLLHCVCSYPTDYEMLNLNFIKTLKKEFPDILIGYSGHDNGILAAVIAYMLGAKVIEKHVTLNHAWKGTDHKFSLEPHGLEKQIRDLKRVDLSLGKGEKVFNDFEQLARDKMGKSLYSSRLLKAGHVIQNADIVIKSPAGGIPPYKLESILGQKLKIDLTEETLFELDHFEIEETERIDSREETVSSCI